MESARCRCARVNEPLSYRHFGASPCGYHWFGDDGVWTALGNGDGTFQEPQLVVKSFGYEAGDWRFEHHPRFLADLTGTGRADIVGFGDEGVWTALSNSDGTFQEPELVVKNFGYEAGDWHVERHPRFLADLTGTGRADIPTGRDRPQLVTEAQVQRQLGLTRSVRPAVF